jgi:hypothetical protein
VDVAFFKYGQYTNTFAVPTKRGSVYCSVEQAHEVPKGLSASIVVDLYPSTAVGLAGLFQG